MKTLATILEEANNYDELSEALGGHPLANVFFTDDKLPNMLADLDEYSGTPADNFHHNLCWQHTATRINQLIATN
ncbi:hypothetical protein PHABIO_389 [Pseudomonas phage Phabio]|uniref:Uncharacterized protein n=1 Tax=Pseudomonas phage Phabio TaxID=2006668 RepID=A0A1Y0SUJ0_9CAUD|nr:hypothetical protein MZD05_gp389 [Pseudomonas phage Phabio]ARV77020.1 hypothetical protein PHABIO_389 [Pseudomonas phage Phabio]